LNLVISIIHPSTYMILKILRSKFEIFDNVCLKKSDAFRLTGKEIYLVFNYSC